VMATCCGIAVFTLWELIAIVAGVIALATNSWLAPQSVGAQCLLGVEQAGLWVVCTGQGGAVTDCSEALNFTVGGNATTDSGQAILNELQNIPDQIQQASSWIFTASDDCTPITDQGAVQDYYSSLPIGATNPKDYWLYIQSIRGLVCAFCGLGFITIICVAAHKPGRGAASGCAHFNTALQVSAGISAIGVFVGMLASITKSDDFVWAQLGATIEDGLAQTVTMWGWSWWLFVGAVAWSILGWIVMCFAFCCAGSAEKY